MAVGTVAGTSATIQVGMEVGTRHIIIPIIIIMTIYGHIMDMVIITGIVTTTHGVTEVV